MAFTRIDSLSHTHVIGVLHATLNEACLAMACRDHMRAGTFLGYAKKIAVMAGVPATKVDDYDLAMGGVYLADTMNLTHINSLSHTDVLGILHTMLNEAVGSEGGLRGGLFLRYAQNTAKLSGVPAMKVDGYDLVRGGVYLSELQAPDLGMSSMS